jgi:hypothetical protein
VWLQVLCTVRQRNLRSVGCIRTMYLSSYPAHAVMLDMTMHTCSSLRSNACYSCTCCEAAKCDTSHSRTSHNSKSAAAAWRRLNTRVKHVAVIADELQSVSCTERATDLLCAVKHLLASMYCPTRRHHIRAVHQWHLGLQYMGKQCQMCVQCTIPMQGLRPRPAV